MRVTAFQAVDDPATIPGWWLARCLGLVFSGLRCGPAAHAARLFVVLAMAAAVGGCGPPDSDAAKTQVVRSAIDGPVEVRLTLSSEHVRLDEPAEVTVEVTADRGVTVQVESIREALAASDERFEYRVTELGEESARPVEGGKLRWSYRYRVNFFLPGEFELPPARVKYLPAADEPDVGAGDEGAAPADKWREVATEPVTVAVADTRPAPPSEAELRELTTLDPVDLPSVWSRWWWVGLLLAAAMVLAAVLVVRAAARRGAVVEPPIPADVWARRQIGRLLAEDLVGKGRIQEFYYRLSDIVRGYIERRFAISAPEMTTEEFLATASTDRRFDRRHTEQLDRFLGACDMVKYARYQPGAGEIDGMLNEAKRFIEDTRQRVAPDPGGTAQAGAAQERAA